MEGGAGNDVYVIQHNGTPPSRMNIMGESTPVIPTRISETDAAGKDTGGTDTIRFVTSDDGIRAYDFVQRGNVVQIQLNTNRVNVGDTIMVSFLSGPTLSNGYTITNVIQGATPGSSIVEFTAANAANISGRALVDGMGINALVDWVDAKTLAVFAAGDLSKEMLDRVSNGAPTIQDYDAKTGAVISDLSIQALIDRNALEFVDLGSNNPEQPGMVVPISFNVGRSNGTEMILSGGPGNAVLSGGEGTDMIIDTPYDDILIGGNGNDLISSQIGFDIVDGGAGNDFIYFRSDKQVLIGGHGADQFLISGLGNSGGALIADFKPWEGDRLGFDTNWLEDFMDGESRLTVPDNYENLRFSVASDPLSSAFFTIRAHMGFTSGPDNSTTTHNFDLVRIQFHSDLDKTWDQIDDAMSQLITSANESQDHPGQWTVDSNWQWAT
jgi:Ca2+-binding RTX toxin-like protein